MLPAYTVEMTPPPGLPMQKGDAQGLHVKRVQEWLTFHGFGTGIDGDYGPATATAVLAFQRHKAINRDSNIGIVDRQTWDALVLPLFIAEAAQPDATGFGDLVCRVARAHLAAGAKEIGGDNRGPWVRHYGHGIDQSRVDFFPWCQVFANAPWLRAARELQLPLPFALVDPGSGRQSAYVPWVVSQARAAGKYLTGGQAAAQAIPPGSMLFVPGADRHQHVGLVMADRGDVVETIEGNTNSAGGSNGFAVCQRFRKKAANDYGLCL